MPSSSDRLPSHRGWPWPDRPTPPAAPPERTEAELRAEVSRLAAEAIRLAEELRATVRRLEETQLEFALLTDGQSLDIARAAIRRAGGGR